MDQPGNLQGLAKFPKLILIGDIIGKIYYK